MRVNVTTTDIKRAQAKKLLAKRFNNSYSCPVALALRRTVKRKYQFDLTKDHLIVGYGTILFTTTYKHSDITALILDAPIRKLIEDFDHGREVEPVSFLIEDSIISNFIAEITT